jgi:hypothetical protein
LFARVEALERNYLSRVLDLNELEVSMKEIKNEKSHQVESFERNYLSRELDLE